ncbi:MAG: zinc ribbon domain-containing protein [Clostridia bacterium]|nr:zinc ribbon domain-containing protein [Clostridia bacterium]
MTCPYCGSINVRSGKTKAGLFCRFGKSGKKKMATHTCRDCGYEWETALPKRFSRSAEDPGEPEMTIKLSSNPPMYPGFREPASEKKPAEARSPRLIVSIRAAGSEEKPRPAASFRSADAALWNRPSGSGFGDADSDRAAEKPPAKRVFCAECGSEIGPDAAFCPNCGAKQ